MPNKKYVSLLRSHAIVWLAALSLNLATVSRVTPQEIGANYQQDQQQQGESLVASFPRSAMEKMANLTQEDSLWILIPSNLSLARLHDSDFSLFKLNAGQLAADVFSRGWPLADGQAQQPRSGREARKLSLFSNVLNKPRVSPLYLVNGTVCRFVNSQPICTTLSTTGLFRGQPGQFMQGQSGLFNGSQQQQQQGANQLPNQRQVSPPMQQQQGYPPQNQQIQPNNQQYNQQYRPLALMDDETPDVSLANRTVVASSGTLAANRPASTQTDQAPSSRPATYVANRRPLSLLSLTRPFRAG